MECGGGNNRPVRSPGTVIAFAIARCCWKGLRDRLVAELCFTSLLLVLVSPVLLCRAFTQGKYRTGWSQKLFGPSSRFAC